MPVIKILPHPEYCPSGAEITAPAVMVGESPSRVESPTSPTPMVPAVVQELPMPMEMAPQITTVAR